MGNDVLEQHVQEHRVSPQGSSDSLVDEYDLDSIEQTRPSVFVWLVAAAAAIGGLLFGYDTGVISGVLVVIGSDLDGRPITDSEKELITSITSGGGFVGAIIAGLLADRFGRRTTIWFASVLFTVGAIVQATSYSIVQMTIGRFLIGLGVGSAAMIVPLYISELSPSRFRGRMVVVDVISITGGQVIAYGIDAAFQYVHGGWRYMVGLGGFPSILLAILLIWCPESPRQLISHDRPEACAVVLRRIYPDATETQVQNKVTLLQRDAHKARAMNESRSALVSLKQLHCVPSNLRALVVACGLMGIQQFCGFNALMYYSSTLFKSIGFNNSIGVGTVVAATNFLFTLISLWKIDRVGRRRILISTMWIMPVALVAAAIAFAFIPLNHSTLDIETSDVGAPGIIVLVAIICYVAAYATGLGNVPWSATELLPSEVRAMGTMLITCTNWGPNIIVSSTFLSMMKGITPSGAFGFYAALSFLGWVAVIFCYPEAAGMTLEETRNLFTHGFGVKYAERVRKERRAQEKKQQQQQQQQQDV